MRFSLCFAVLFAVLVPQIVLAGPLKILKGIEKRYRHSTSIQMDVEKTVVVKLLERTTKSKGKILIGSEGKFRWETTEPDKNVLLINGRNIWIVDYPRDEGEKTRVLKSSNMKKAKPHALIAFLLGQGKLSDNYKVASDKEESGNTKLNLKPKNSGDQVKAVTIVLGPDKKVIKEISFEDESGNLTALSFTNVVFDQKLEKSTFAFALPKNAVVTDMD